MSDHSISADFPFESHFADVLGSPMHYVDEGEGDPILFLHGNPTSSYLWRNVIPHVQSVARCIALDLVGMGRSGKPDIDYRFVDHARYLEAFIEALELRNITLCLHDWGSALGFDYSFRHQDNVKAIAFMEAITRAPSWKEQTFMTRFLFKRLRHPVKGRKMIVDKNFFVEKALPMMSARKLSEAEMDRYREPFREPSDRKPVLVWPREIPFDGDPPDTYARISAYEAWLPQSRLPKLMFHVKPGLIIPMKEADKLKAGFENIETVFLGKGRHFTPEEHPREIGTHLAQWYRNLVRRGRSRHRPAV